MLSYFLTLGPMTEPAWMWLLHQSYVTVRGISESPECPTSALGPVWMSHRLSLEGDKQDSKHPDDKSEGSNVLIQKCLYAAAGMP